MVKGDKFDLNQCPKNDLEREFVKAIPFFNVVVSFMYT